MTSDKMEIDEEENIKEERKEIMKCNENLNKGNEIINKKEKIKKEKPKKNFTNKAKLKFKTIDSFFNPK